jgi:hypothetical protein
MKATEVNFLKFLKQPNQFIIPIYQRTYSFLIKAEVGKTLSLICHSG